MCYCFHSQVYQVLTIVKRYDLYIFRQYVLIQISYLIFQIRNHFSRILSLSHHHNALNNIILIHSPHLSETGQAGFMNFRQVLYQNRSSIDILNHDISQLIQVINQTDATNHIGLRAFRDHISANINITFGYRIIQFKGSNSIINQLVRIYTYLKGLHLATEAHNIGNTRYRTEIPFNHPVLNRF